MFQGGKEMTLLIRNFAFLAPWVIIIIPASQRRIRDLGKMHFPESPIFPPQFLLPAKIRRSFRGIKMREK